MVAGVVVIVLIALGIFVGSADGPDGAESATSPRPGSSSSQPYTSSSGQRYDEKGFPLDASGQVSDEPADYREPLCATGLFDDAPECD
jgi:hypothetical protein